jgi:predicted DCC family thiol-disulfide oxidoreductase YuxK
MDYNSIVFFDGVCNFCNYTVDFIWENNPKRSLYYTSLQSEFAQHFLKEHDLPLDNFDTIYFFENNTIYKKSEALIHIGLHLTFFKRMLLSLGFIIPKSLLNFGYSFFSKHRYKVLGKKETCRIPTQEEVKYFLT